MRDIVVKIGGADVSLRGTFGAAEEVMRHIGDPIALIKENHLASAIPAYRPKLSLTVANIPVVLWIGAKAAGDKRAVNLRCVAVEPTSCTSPRRKANASLRHRRRPQRGSNMGRLFPWRVSGGAGLGGPAVRVLGYDDWGVVG